MVKRILKILMGVGLLFISLGSLYGHFFMDIKLDGLRLGFAGAIIAFGFITIRAGIKDETII